ncbi:MAG: hypothetical protein WCG31_09320 [Deltaproteobacteria bacterium]
MAYEKAKNLDELHIAACKHLYYYANSIMQSICLDSTHPQSLHNDVYCACALIELFKLREFIKESKRWPELSGLLDQVFSMSCEFYAAQQHLSDAMIVLLWRQGMTRLNQFQGDPDCDLAEQVGKVVKLEGVNKDKINKALLIQTAIIQTENLEPFFLIDAYDKIMAS